MAARRGGQASLKLQAAGAAGSDRKSIMFGIPRPRTVSPSTRRETATRYLRIARAGAYDDLARARRDQRRGRIAGSEGELLAVIRGAETRLAALEAQARLVARGDDQAIRRVMEIADLQHAA